MTQINNKTELVDLIQIIEELEGYSQDFDSTEVMDAAAHLLAIAKGDVAKKKVYDAGYDRSPRVMDTYAMMMSQPRYKTFKHLSAYNHFDDCVLANYEKQKHINNLMWG